jgi:hypothetical protein
LIEDSPDTAGGRVTSLVQTMFAELNGEISPDGRWLAYESNESGQFQIYQRPFPALDQRRWQISTASGRQPLWARNMRKLFDVGADGALMGVAIDAVQGGRSFAAGTPAKLVKGAGYRTALGTPNFDRTYDESPDGERFLRIKVNDEGSSSAEANVVVVQNCFEELKRLVPTN